MVHFGTRTAGVVFAALVLAAGATPAQAAFINNNFGLTSPATTIDFENPTFDPNTPLTTQYLSQGVTFDGLYYDSGDGTFNTYPNFSGHYAGNFTSPNFDDPNASFTIFFSTTQTSAAFAFAAFGMGDTTFQVFLNGVEITSETMTIPTDETSTSNYFGFSGFSFDAIRVTPGVFPDDGGPRPAVIDNIQLGNDGSSVNPVPAPPGLVLMATGFLGLIGFRYRSRKSQTPVVV